VVIRVTFFVLFYAPVLLWLDIIGLARRDTPLDIGCPVRDPVRYETLCACAVLENKGDPVPDGTVRYRITLGFEDGASSKGVI